jgi:hypothetical protein
MNFSDLIHAVHENISRNIIQVETQLKAAQQAVKELDDECLAAIQTLLKKFEHPQAISQFITAVAQSDGLQKAHAEMTAAITVLKTAALDQDFQQKAVQLAASGALAAEKAANELLKVPAPSADGEEK